MTSSGDRIEHDSMGAVPVPATALWGAQTQRALANFPASGMTMPAMLIRALGLIKYAAAAANVELGDLPMDMGQAIQAAANEIADGAHLGEFPVDVFQTGSGTSSNMNANEVIARLAQIRLGKPVHPNDHVNRSQSSNDTIPTAIHVAAVMSLEGRLLPALDSLGAVIARRTLEFSAVVKTGRTHLMDAMPLTLGQELGGWRAQIEQSRERLKSVLPRLYALAQGGTAVGTGINARSQFGPVFARALALRTGLPFKPAENYFAALSCQDTAVELSGQLRVLAVGLMKIANDLRWMNSGPLSGLGEIALPALQPGSSIMPGKVNPVIPESVTMIAAQVMGNDVTIMVAGQSGNFQLNVMLPIIAYNVLQSIELLTIAVRNLGEHAIAGFTIDRDRLSGQLACNPILITALNPIIGYEKAANIAKAAYAQGREIVDVAAEMSDLSRDELRRLLDPTALTTGGPR